MKAPRIGLACRLGGLSWFLLLVTSFSTAPAPAQSPTAPSPGVPATPSGSTRWPSWASIFAAPTPHPAVVRVEVTEDDSSSLGSGTLVDVAERHALVVTNWHVVRDASGPIMVTFPDGFRSAAQVLQVDQQWDLAALLIWRPKVAPVPLAATAPRPGERLTIAGYGSGRYRSVSGRCTQYVSPSRDLPYEMVELSAEARQGDSGGPIFNERGELAGVLFGASHGTTAGSYAGRVQQFLAPLRPMLAAADAGSLAATPNTASSPPAAPNRSTTVATRPPTQPMPSRQYGAGASPVESRSPATRWSQVPQPTQDIAAATRRLPNVQANAAYPFGPSSNVGASSGYGAAVPSESDLGMVAVDPTADWPPSGNERELSRSDFDLSPAGSVSTPLGRDLASEPDATADSILARIPWKQIAGDTPWEQTKMFFAVIGFLAMFVHFSRRR